MLTNTIYYNLRSTDSYIMFMTVRLCCNFIYCCWFL